MTQTALSKPTADHSSLRTVNHLVLFHGLASTPREFGLLEFPLRRMGVTLHTPTLSGYSHGMRTGDARWQDWVREGSARVDEIAARHGRVVIGGLCTGAVLALAIDARRRSDAVAGLALLSPPFAYDGWGLPWWYQLRHLAYRMGIAHRFRMRERSPYGLKNERLRQWVQQEMESGQASMSGPARIPLQLVRESERLSLHARGCLGGLRVPTLVLHAREDEICNVSSVRAALAHAPENTCRLAVLENSYHMITADNDRQLVAQELARHATSSLAPHREETRAFG